MSLPILTTPKYSCNIPSTGQRITFRPYLVKEERILMVALESKDQTEILEAIKTIVRSCTFDAVETD